MLKAGPDRSQELSKVAAVKAKVGPASFRFSDRQLLHLIDLTGSVGLACDALCMVPQPRFLDAL